MKLLIDADGCPVTDIAVRTAVKFGIECVIICDTAHSIVREGARTITVDKGADSADLRLVNLVSAGDIAVTQDYGLAAMCLSKNAVVLNQDGRTKGLSKRTKQQDVDFEAALCRSIAERECLMNRSAKQITLA